MLNVPLLIENPFKKFRRLRRPGGHGRSRSPCRSRGSGNKIYDIREDHLASEFTRIGQRFFSIFPTLQINSFRGEKFAWDGKIRTEILFVSKRIRGLYRAISPVYSRNLVDSILVRDLRG
jgi:hypothetical protein